jgi:CobQ-like glutamine amidotransferase family enzyme
MEVKRVVIAHLYPREMNIYGDMGNIITLVKRLGWRGYDPVVKEVEVGKPFDLAEADIVFGGGGQDSGQLIVGEDLVKRGEDLAAMAGDGVPMLVVCGLYQLFGRGFTTMEGQEIPGISVFRASTVGSRVRMIGNIEIDSKIGVLVGFENHSGQTILEPQQAALGQVRKGFGNNPKSGREGAITGNAVGTYMHGPVLPKNPALADTLIAAALRRRWGVTQLEPLGDEAEMAAAIVAASRPQ